MQQNYLTRLCSDVQDFVLAIEAATGVDVEVVEDATLNAAGPFGLGQLKVDIEAQRVHLLIPENGYFPDGAVRHELLHVHRLHVEQVPRLALADHVDWNPRLEAGLMTVDNALEHLVIVPQELNHHPERRAHWEAVMARVWTVDIPQASSELDRRIGACLHWTFLERVLPGSPSLDVAVSWLGTQGWRPEAERFSEEIWSRVTDKVATVGSFFDMFPQLPRADVALEYLSSMTGSRLVELPDG